MISISRVMLGLTVLLLSVPAAVTIGLDARPVELPSTSARDDSFPFELVPSAPTPVGTFVDAFPRASSSAAEPFGVKFVCPAANAGDGQAKVDGQTCPNKVVDMEDLMGQPQLVVDPMDPSIQAFHALHGGRGINQNLLDPPPPTARSRYNTLHQPHTTFQSTDGGKEWVDQRYYAMEGLQGPNRTIYGEDNAITVDAQGHGYIAALYSFRDDGTQTYSWAVALYKTQRLNRYVSYYENNMLVHADSTGGDAPQNIISNLFLSYSPQANSVVVMWLETPVDIAGKPSEATWVEAYRTAPGEGAIWERLPLTQRIMGCRDISNPIAYGGEIFFGCLPGPAYRAQQNATAERWQIHAIDPTPWTTRHVAATPVVAAHGLLVDIGHTGWMYFVGSGLEGGKPIVRVSIGAAGRSWKDYDDYGSRFSMLPAESKTKVLDARVTAAAYTKMHGYLHTIYMEHYDMSDQVDRIQANQRALAFDKSYVVIRPTSKAFEGSFHDQLRFGEPSSLTGDPGPVYSGGNQEIFDDLHDSIIIWEDKERHRERIFTAFGDYGNVRTAEVLEENVGIPPFFPPIEAIAIPLAAGSAAPSSTGAVVIAMTALMLLRMLVAKKKTVAKAPSL